MTALTNTIICFSPGRHLFHQFHVQRTSCRHKYWNSPCVISSSIACYTANWWWWAHRHAARYQTHHQLLRKHYVRVMHQPDTVWCDNLYDTSIHITTSYMWSYIHVDTASHRGDTAYSLLKIEPMNLLLIYNVFGLLSCFHTRPETDYAYIYI